MDPETLITSSNYGQAAAGQRFVTRPGESQGEQRGRASGGKNDRGAHHTAAENDAAP